MLWQTLTEGKATIRVPTAKIVSADLPVFYNPAMEHHRSTTIWLLQALKRKKLQVGLPLAGSGVRGIRFFKELPSNMVKSISFNDRNIQAVWSIKNNLKLNKISLKKMKVSNKEANQFLLDSEGFDYIDIDPFGPPTRFLPAAIERLARNGILAVTATDTSALCGSYPKACRRKYWAEPLNNELCQEIGLRILIRRAQLVGADYDKALTPILAYAKDHYHRVFFVNEKQKQQVDLVLSQHKFLLFCEKCRYWEVSKRNAKQCCDVTMMYAGPLWAGALADSAILRAKTADLFIQQLQKELMIQTVGFYDLPALAKSHKFRQIPQTAKVLETLNKNNIPAARTTFGKNGIRVIMGYPKLVDMLKGCQ